MTQAIIVLNAGSSSIKFAIYEVDRLEVLCRGAIDGLGGAAAGFKVAGGIAHRFDGDARDSIPAAHDAAIAWLAGKLKAALAGTAIVAAGHRVVHGGARFEAPVRLDQAIMAQLARLVALAPLHEPYNLGAIRAVSQIWPELPQVACFDTQFHRSQPRLAQLFALPRDLTDAGVLRYGFHGLSYEYIAGVLPSLIGDKADGRVIVAHLGNGASACAMRGRKSIATTMGFTALDGLMMGTRAGALDPGVVLHLIEQRGMTAADVSDLLYNRSGLLGVSGISGDVRTLEASVDPRAAEALDLFAYRCAREIGSLMAALDGLDVLVFTGGIGEHSVAMRRKICDRLTWAGVKLDAGANSAGGQRIGAAGAAVDVFAIPTDEEIVIARATRRIGAGG